MKTTTQLYFLFIYVVTLTLIEGAHFKGGTITYKVLETYGSIVSISLTQTYIYTHTQIPCNDTMIAAQPPPLLENDASNMLICSQYCDQSGGYTSIPVNSFCTDYSTALDITVGQRSDIINITDGSYFLVAFKGKSWHRLYSQAGSSTSSSWSVRCLINLQVRSNGEYNHPPASIMMSSIYIPVGIPQEIVIPAIDADNDDIRCRFAEGTEECGDVCYPASLPDGTDLLSDCTLLITGANTGDWYAVAIMIEDFVNSTTRTPLSSITVQFLINVRRTTKCLSPRLTGPVAEFGQCVNVLVGQSYSIQLTVEHTCLKSTIIKDIATLSFPNVIKTPIVRNTTSIWSTSLTWIPTMEQIGSQILCAIATDSSNIQSNQYCITFTVAEGSISSYPEETTMPTTQSTTVDLTSILTTIDSTPGTLLTSWHDDQVLIDTTTPPIITLQQTMTTPLTSVIQSTVGVTSHFLKLFSMSESTESTTDLYETSSKTSLSLESLISSSNFQQMSSTSDQKNDDNNLIVVSLSLNSPSPWPWAAPLIAIAAGCLIAFSIWFFCCYLSCCRFTCCRKHSPVNDITHQGNIIRPPNRPDRIDKIFENKQNSNINNVHQSHSLNNADNHTSKNTPLSTSLPVNNVKSHTPTSLTESYIFGDRHASKMNE